MATVIGGIGISHTPSMGTEYDRGIASPDGFSPRWQPWYDGTRRVEELLERLAPDHLVVVYNDHLNHFDLDNYPTLAIGVGARFRQADEGWGPRDLPDLEGDTRWGLPGHLDELVSVPVREYMRLGGTDAAELTLWFTMRAALSEQATALYTFQTFPTITGCGALVMAEPGALHGASPSTGLGADGSAGDAVPGSGSEAGS